MPNAAILIIGNEILSGSTQDINSGWMARQLTERGIDVDLIVTVPDQRELITSWVRRLHREHTYLFTSGGIGPTPDDVTREAIADALEVPLEKNDDAEALFQSWVQRELTEFDRKMALLPQGTRMVYGHESGIPGFLVQDIVILPGVPKLLQIMFLAVVNELDRGHYESRSVRTHLFEGQIAGVMIEFEKEWSQIRIGSYPQWDGHVHHVDLRLEAKIPDVIDEALEWLQGRLEAVDSTDRGEIFPPGVGGGIEPHGMREG